MIEAAVRSLLAIDYPDYELVVVDDRSEDATGEILERLKAENGAVGVVHVRELPAGWLGKTHAMWRAAERSPPASGFCSAMPMWCTRPRLCAVRCTMPSRSRPPHGAAADHADGDAWASA